MVNRAREAANQRLREVRRTVRGMRDTELDATIANYSDAVPGQYHYRQDAMAEVVDRRDRRDEIYATAAQRVCGDYREADNIYPRESICYNCAITNCPAYFTDVRIQPFKTR